VFWSKKKTGLWETEIARFEAEDRANPPRPGVIVFTGSSSIRKWSTLVGDMKPLDVIGRGFGGSQLAHVNEYAGRIVIPYRPRAVVLYAGENDLSWGRPNTPESVTEDFKRFVTIVHTPLPETWIYYISMKSAPLRWGNREQMRATNRLIEQVCRTQERVQYIDVATPMLGPNGKPRRELFRWDHLHMNARGYAIWTPIIKSVLMARFGPGATSSADSLVK
jgi:lysophospholipase L1-like esterase